MTWSLLTLNSLNTRHSRSHQRSAEFLISRQTRIQVLRTGGVFGTILCRRRRGWGHRRRRLLKRGDPLRPFRRTALGSPTFPLSASALQASPSATPCSPRAAAVPSSTGPSPVPRQLSDAPFSEDRAGVQWDAALWTGRVAGESRRHARAREAFSQALGAFGFACRLRFTALAVAFAIAASALD